jgi:hypothetical protein
LNSSPSSKIDLKLAMQKPFAGTNFIEFTLSPVSNETPSRNGWWFSRLFGIASPEPQRTLVTWTMTGKNTIFSKLMSIFMNCDKIIGEQFEEGLSNLQSIFRK